MKTYPHCKENAYECFACDPKTRECKLLTETKTPCPFFKERGQAKKELAMLKRRMIERGTYDAYFGE